MQSITFTCEIITPMFLSGADGTTPELRAPSIKGAMRFWWRAMHGHLDLDKLKKKEAKIFGSPDEKFGRSKVLIRVPPPTQPLTVNKNEQMVPHKPTMTRRAFNAKQRFDVHLSLMPTDAFTFEQLKNLFILTCVLGGFGKRVRRGMGSVSVVGCSDSSWKKEPIDLAYIHRLIQPLSAHYRLGPSSIQSTYAGRTGEYPWLEQVEIGKPNEKVLRLISDTTHKVKEANGRKYESALGHAFKGRFASPIYVSTIVGPIKPIISTLHAVPGTGFGVDSRVQKEFKRSILE
ncbi:MAG: type III-B CRISPR module RAMP protein Cmr1 [Chitinophagales bacterium]|nr:type III-B CRISPR module RAMP protein Cmr1 [Chitinophagales bacterium]